LNRAASCESFDEDYQTREDDEGSLSGRVDFTVCS
jgi:hypothetical protein